MFTTQTQRSWVTRLQVATLIIGLLGLVGLYIGYLVQEFRQREAIIRCDILLTARGVEAYRSATGRYPAFLKTLSPVFLPDERYLKPRGCSIDLHQSVKYHLERDQYTLMYTDASTTMSMWWFGPRECRYTSVSAEVRCEWIEPERSGMHQPNAADTHQQHKSAPLADTPARLLRSTASNRALLELRYSTPVKHDISWIPALGFSNDTHLVAVSDTSGEISLWETATGKRHRFLQREGPSAMSLAFTTDGTLLASSHNAYITVRDLSTVWERSGHVSSITLNSPSSRTYSVGYSINSVAFSPDGRLLASGAVDGTITLWEVNTWKELKTFQAHTDSVLSIAFSPDGKTLVSGSRDTFVKLWDVTRMTLRTTLPGHAREITAVEFSPDGMTLGAASNDGAILLWNPYAGTLLHTLWEDPNTCSELTMSLSSRFVASGCTGDGVSLVDVGVNATHGNISLWEISTGELIARQQPAGAIKALAFSPDGSFVMTGSTTQDGAIKRWDVVQSPEQ